VAYAVIEKSGCGIHKGRTKLRIDCFMNPDDPHFDKHYVYVPVFPEGGYPGKVNELGQPKDQKDYDAWVESLPHIWQNNPFHSHFIYPDKEVADNYIKEQIERTLDYFHTFHTYCWDTGQQFCGKDKDGKIVGLWERVPFVKGSIRDIFVAGDTKDLTVNQLKVADILTRLPDFQIGKTSIIPPPLNIGDKGTIDVGIATFSATGWANRYVTVNKGNPSNADGEIDTALLYCANEITVCWVGTFSASGNTLTCRDSEDTGTVASGSEQTKTGLHIDILTDDYIGAWWQTGNPGMCHRSGGEDLWYKLDVEPPTYIIADASTAFTVYSGYELALYGTGTEAGAGLSIPIAMHHYMQMANN